MPALADLGKGQEFGDVATNGTAERAVLKLIASHGDQARETNPIPPSARR